MTHAAKRPPWLRALEALPTVDRDAIEHHARSFTRAGRPYFIRLVLADLGVKDGTRKLNPPTGTADGLEDFRTGYGRDLLDQHRTAAVNTVRERRRAAELAGAANPNAGDQPCSRCGERPATTTAPDPYTDDAIGVCAECADLLSAGGAPPTLNA